MPSPLDLPWSKIPPCVDSFLPIYTECGMIRRKSIELTFLEHRSKKSLSSAGSTMQEDFAHMMP